MKKLKELLNGVNVGKVYGDTDREIGHIHFDSRKIEPGDVFIAQRGVNADGHAFIDKALTRGAVAVVCEQLPENRPEEVTYIWTADTSEALGVMAGNYWDNPSRELKLVGVTGTNGKTTTATLLYELVRLAGEKAGLVSTVWNYIGEDSGDTYNSGCAVYPGIITADGRCRMPVLFYGSQFACDPSEKDCRSGFRRGYFFQYYTRSSGLS